MRGSFGPSQRDKPAAVPGESWIGGQARDHVAGGAVRSPMIISVINLSRNEISDSDLLTAIRAINQQIEYDFAPFWGMPATLRLEGSLLT